MYDLCTDIGRPPYTSLFPTTKQRIKKIIMIDACRKFLSRALRPTVAERIEPEQADSRGRSWGCGIWSSEIARLVLVREVGEVDGVQELWGLG